MRLTEQYLKKVIRQMIREQSEDETQMELDRQQAELSGQKQGVEARLKHRSVHAGLEEVHRLLQSNIPADAKMKEIDTIVARLLRGIESGHLQLK